MPYGPEAGAAPPDRAVVADHRRGGVSLPAAEGAVRPGRPARARGRAPYACFFAPAPVPGDGVATDADAWAFARAMMRRNV